MGTCFENFADHAFHSAHQQRNALGTPSFSSTTRSAPQDKKSFAGNFVFTFNNFWNRPHVDQDKGDVFCVWYPIQMFSGNIVTGTEGFELEGGWFVIPEYRLPFNFGDQGVFQMN